MALSPGERRTILERFGLADVISEPLALPEGLGSEVIISRDDRQWSPYFVTVKVRDIEHLKQLAGIPSNVAASAMASDGYQVPGSGGSDVADQAMAALFGDWAGSLGEEKSAPKVEEFMMTAAAELPIFATTDLVVQSGETYTLTGAPTFYFDSITVHGTGEIVTEGQIKIISDSIEYIPT